MIGFAPSGNQREEVEMISNLQNLLIELFSCESLVKVPFSGNWWKLIGVYFSSKAIDGSSGSCNAIANGFLFRSSNQTEATLVLALGAINR